MCDVDMEVLFACTDATAGDVERSGSMTGT